MDFFDAVEKRHSVRRYRPDSVPEAALRSMLEAARLAPSATNTQPWHFLVIRDREMLAQLQAMVNAIAEAKLAGDLTLRERRQVQRLLPNSQQFAAPAAIAVLGRMRDASVYFEPVLQSVSAAVAQLQLAATALGYGSCWATGPVALAGEELEALLGVERPWRLLAVISVGLPEERPRRTSRKKMEEMTTFL